MSVPEKEKIKKMLFNVEVEKRIDKKIDNIFEDVKEVNENIFNYLNKIEGYKKDTKKSYNGLFFSSVVTGLGLLSGAFAIMHSGVADPHFITNTKEVFESMIKTQPTLGSVSVALVGAGFLNFSTSLLRGAKNIILENRAYSYIKKEKFFEEKKEIMKKIKKWGEENNLSEVDKMIYFIEKLSKKDYFHMIDDIVYGEEIDFNIPEKVREGLEKLKKESESDIRAKKYKGFKNNDNKRKI